MRIMVVDDCRALGRAIGRALRGHDVVIEDDPDRALDRLDNGEWFDLILCDMKMPKRLGTEVLSAIRSMYGADAPTLVLMSGADEGAQGSGADAFILKPFQSSELQSLIAFALEMREQRRTVATRRIPILRYAVGC